jgi:serine/threonine-protein kinase
LTRDYWKPAPQGYSRGEGCTSTDAAGFPVAPLLFTADEVAAGEIKHAIRFALPNWRMQAGVYVHPATHYGGPSATDANAPPYGVHLRLKSTAKIGGLSAGAQVVARALQKYGMFLSDGGEIALMAQADTFTKAKWDPMLGPGDLSSLAVTDFEKIGNEPLITTGLDCHRTGF